MLQTLIILLIMALVLYLVFFVCGKFITGTPLQIIGIILGLIWLLYALNALGLFPALR
jgi:amino acid transporter